MFLYLVMDDFQQFEAFQKCRILVRAVGALVNNGTFSKDSVLVTQLRRTMLSIYSNFGEGFERDGNREFIQFLSISKASIGELCAQLLYALDLGYLDSERFEELNDLAREAARYVGGLIRHLKKSAFRGHKYNQNEPPRSASKHIRRIASQEGKT